MALAVIDGVSGAALGTGGPVGGWVPVGGRRGSDAYGASWAKDTCHCRRWGKEFLGNGAVFEANAILVHVGERDPRYLHQFLPKELLCRRL